MFGRIHVMFWAIAYFQCLGVCTFGNIVHWRVIVVLWAIDCSCVVGACIGVSVVLYLWVCVCIWGCVLYL